MRNLKADITKPKLSAYVNNKRRVRKHVWFFSLGYPNLYSCTRQDFGVRIHLIYQPESNSRAATKKNTPSWCYRWVVRGTTVFGTLACICLISQPQRLPLGSIKTNLDSSAMTVHDLFPYLHFTTHKLNTKKLVHPSHMASDMFILLIRCDSKCVLFISL